MHQGECGAARRTIESAGQLGSVRPGDVTSVGSRGEAVDGKPGSVVREMIDKHPARHELDASGFCSLERLLSDAQSEHPDVDIPSPEAISDLIEEAFELRAFELYCCKRPKMRMPGCDMIRFEHVAALVRAGFGGDVLAYVLLYAKGTLPSELQPFACGGRLVAPSKPGTLPVEHRPIGAGVTWRRLAAGFLASAFS